MLDKPPQEIVKSLINFQDITNASKDLHIVQKFEEILEKWIRKVNILIIQSNEIRSEADDTGPFAELDYFRRVSLRFYCVLEQLKEPEHKLTIQVLNASGNRKLWVKRINKSNDSIA